MENLIKKEIRVRIAPSPTGNLHIGTARTSLINYLFAKKNEGKFILRIEDTDLLRSDPIYEKNIIDGLKWLNIIWDEGPDIGGKYGPYRQKERTGIYSKYIKKLLDEDLAYYCFCSEEELKVRREYQMSIGEAPKYSGECSNIKREEAEKRIKNGERAVIRFRCPKKKIKFKDLIRKEVEFDGSLIGDFVVAKNTETPLYNLAVIIDDFEMKISHVIRGEDHISNTPKQIFLIEALSLPVPIYGHLPMILGPDKSKMSKRHGATSVIQYKEEGFLPEALINFMTLLGWNSGTDKELFSLSDLEKEFSIERVQKSGAIFNIEKLEFFNSLYIRKKTIEELTKLCIPYLINSNLIEKKNEEYIIKETGERVSLKKLEQFISLYQERIKKLSEISELINFFFKKDLEYEKNLLIWKNMTDEELKSSLDKVEELLSKINNEDFIEKNITNILMEEAERIGNRGVLLWPMRVALSGKKASANPFEIAHALGKEKTLQRIKKAKELL